MKRYAELTGNRKKHGIKSLCVNKLDYRGEIIVALHNDNSSEYYPAERKIRKGDRIAQLVIQPYMPVILQEVDDLSETERGAGGFGSTDHKKDKTSDGIYDYEQITLYDVLKDGGE